LYLTTFPDVLSLYIYAATQMH